MANFDHKIILALNAHPKIGSQTLKKLIFAVSNPEQLWTLSKNELSRKIEPKLLELLFQARADYQPELEFEKIKKYDVGYVTIFDKEYPTLLKEIPDAPVILYMRGSPEALKRPGLGVVGSRKYTDYGSSVAYKLTKSLAESGLTIISGLALGIDAIAHQAALDANGMTVGVLGCGLDRIYPVSNHNLGKAMIERGGAIISEFPIGTPPTNYNFPIRNRIIAGLSLGTLVVEAALDSGSLITAGLALDYNREVFAVPGGIDSPMSEGTNKLIKQGAIPVTCASDVLSVLDIEEKKSAEKAREILPENENEKKIYEILRSGERSGDEIIKASKLNVIELNSVLTMMELKGMVKNIGGGRYKIS
ncbi:MAG: DNA-processing protein DprA [Patescibacteria group bacterium]|jgi:DNA processing protein